MNHLVRMPRRGWIPANDLENLMEGFLRPVRHFSPAKGTLMPAMDVVESRDGYAVKADLPGVVQDGLHVSVRDNVHWNGDVRRTQRERR